MCIVICLRTVIGRVFDTVTDIGTVIVIFTVIVTVIVHDMFIANVAFGNGSSRFASTVP